MDIFKIDEDYCRYLHDYDDTVRISYDEKARRKYLGIVLEVNDITYFAPLGSPKAKYDKMPNNKIDCIKINDGKWGVINLSNMIPLADNTLANQINIKPLLSDSYSEIQYKQLLINQTNWCKNNTSRIQKNAKTVYRICVSQPNGKFAQHCTKFKLLEEKSKLYKLNDSLAESANLDLTSSSKRSI